MHLKTLPTYDSTIYGDFMLHTYVSLHKKNTVQALRTFSDICMFLLKTKSVFGNAGKVKFLKLLYKVEIQMCITTLHMVNNKLSFNSRWGWLEN